MTKPKGIASKSKRLSKIKSILITWDIYTAIGLFLLALFFFPSGVSNSLAKDIFSTALTVLAIVFSIFFAALAFIISANEDGFVEFLEEDSIYSHILWTFKFTLVITFIALIFSIISYFLTLIWSQTPNSSQYKILICLCIFLFAYSLFAVINSVFDTIKYAHYRLKYIRKIRELNKK